ncbi:9017_t:CDS:2 [Gigaspora margarita]|uniref:9017_t:CDS:1 n=1 Tax=Gigaspora margarita TaxID=4874 RepID=A0ABN7VDN3_GIGMA|nr:9017_t:CDS:2 [Gigaspora margarita]
MSLFIQFHIEKRKKNIYSQAATFAVANSTSHTHLLLKVFDRMKQKQWVKAKFLWVENLSLHNKLKTGCVSLFGSLSEHLYLCAGKATSTRQIDRQLPLILVVNVAGINITNEGLYLECKNLLEEISFSSENANIKQRYRLMGASFCDSNYYIADVRFENIKNVGWYHYNSLEKTYCARAMYIGSLLPSHKNGYAIDFVIYIKI